MTSFMLKNIQKEEDVELPFNGFKRSIVQYNKTLYLKDNKKKGTTIVRRVLDSLVHI